MVCCLAGQAVGVGTINDDIVFRVQQFFGLFHVVDIE